MLRDVYAHCQPEVSPQLSRLGRDCRLPIVDCRRLNMLAYILRRLLLMIPTIFGIMAVSFAIVQFVPGGPVERMIAQLQGTDQSSSANFGGGGGADRRGHGAGRRRHFLALSRLARARSEIHQGAREAVRLRQAAARALLDPGARLRDLQFRQKLLPRRAGAAADREKLPVSISLGMWMTFISYAISIPLGIRKAVQGRLALRHLRPRRSSSSATPSRASCSPSC